MPAPSRQAKAAQRANNHPGTCHQRSLSFEPQWLRMMMSQRMPWCRRWLHVILGRACHMLSQGGRVTCYPGRACHMLSQGGRVTCYPGARVSHGIQGQAKRVSHGTQQTKQSRSGANQTVTPGMSHVMPGRTCHMLPQGARVTCYPWGARCSCYELNLADWLTSSWLKVIEATRTVHAKVMMRLRAGCPLFWLRVEPG